MITFIELLCDANGKYLFKTMLAQMLYMLTSRFCLDNDSKGLKHYNDVIMGAIVYKITDDRWIPRTNGQ